MRRPIYRSSVGRWRRDEEVLKPLLDGLGPDLAGDRTDVLDNHPALIWPTTLGIRC